MNRSWNKIELARSKLDAFVFTRQAARASTSNPQGSVWVILCGFMGATLKNMDRHASVYLTTLSDELTVHIISITAPICYVLKQGIQESDNYSIGLYAVLAKDVRDLCTIGTCTSSSTNTSARRHTSAELPATLGPVLIHVCSQNGAFLYRALCAGTNNKWCNRIIATVFDSAPVFLTTAAVDQAISQAIGRVNGWAVSQILRVMIGGQGAYEHAMATQKDMYTQWLLRGQGGRKAPPHCFLFSFADCISESSYIKSLLQAKRKEGVCVQWHDFGGSGHMQHVVQYPTEYTKQLKQFLSKCTSIPVSVSDSDSVLACTGGRDLLRSRL